MYPSFVWSKPTAEKIIYLTFDDGPIPGVTEWVLDQLTQYQAKATFFCVGDNIRKHPAVYEQTLRQGHSVGNHTFNHLNGWQTETDAYLENFRQFEQTVPRQVHLFRPPYGRITRRQARIIRQTHQIVMWDVLSGDFDPKLDANVCLQQSIRHSGKGSIIVFHDSLKAQKNLLYVLPRYLTHFAAQGYRFNRL